MPESFDTSDSKTVCKSAYVLQQERKRRGYPCATYMIVLVTDSQYYVNDEPQFEPDHSEKPLIGGITAEAARALAASITATIPEG